MLKTIKEYQFWLLFISLCRSNLFFFFFLRFCRTCTAWFKSDKISKKKKKDFWGWRPQSPFSISSSFVLFFVLPPFFLKTKMFTKSVTYENLHFYTFFPWNIPVGTEAQHAANQGLVRLHLQPLLALLHAMWWGCVKAEGKLFCSPTIYSIFISSWSPFHSFLRDPHNVFLWSATSAQSVKVALRIYQPTSMLV